MIAVPSVWYHAQRILLRPYSSRAISNRTGKLRSDVATLVACDVFITAGAHPLHTPLLRNLLWCTQQRIRAQLGMPSSDKSVSDTEHDKGTMTDPWVENAPVGALIHARSDPVYNRSSFHLVGSESVIGSVARDLCVQAVREWRVLQNHVELQHFVCETQHPNVGFVDHVCTMPLIDPASATQDALSLLLPSSANVARTVGVALRDELDVRVLFYSLAHHTRRDFADVRSKATRHLKRLASLVTPSDFDRPELCTVGAHTHFFEHFTVRLNAVCGKKRARHVRRLLTEYDDKLPHVDVLSLPYSQDRHELSCLLQRPKESSASHVVTTIQRYMKTCKDDVEIETSFRLRPTATQCLDLLRNVSRSEEHRTEYDTKVATTFETYFA